jgi:YgiT-type zinc finger domain-containing protein
MSEHCVFCGHKHLNSKTTRYIYQKDQLMLVVENVPCLECTFCGKQYFDAVVLQKIENDYCGITHQHRQPQRIIQVAVENFSALSL